MFSSGPSRETTTINDGNSDLNNRPYNAPLSNNNEIEYFLPGPSKESDKKASALKAKQFQKEFEDAFTGIGCFDGMFSLQVKSESKPYQALPRHIAYALQKLFKGELERFQQQDIITLLGIDEMAEWFNSFIFVPKPNGKVRLCLDLARLNQALIRPVHRGHTFNDIFPKLNDVKCLSLIDASSGYHNLKLDE